jgi:xanthine/uracil permease
MQGLILICLTIIACLGILDKQSISILFGTIVGYAFAVSKEEA